MSEHVWFEHEVTNGSDKGKTYYNQPKTGRVVWTKPEGVEKKKDVSKGVRKKPPKRPSMIVPPSGVKGAENQPPPGTIIEEGKDDDNEDDHTLKPPPSQRVKYHGRSIGATSARPSTTCTKMGEVSCRWPEGSSGGTSTRKCYHIFVIQLLLLLMIKARCRLRLFL